MVAASLTELRRYRRGASDEGQETEDRKGSGYAKSNPMVEERSAASLFLRIQPRLRTILLP